jgi:hypothetical protein
MMKIFTKILAIAMVVLIFACNKDNVTSLALVGKWKATESLVSAGGPAYWVAAPAKTNYDYIQFDQDGKLEGSAIGDYVKYAVKDSVTVVFSKRDNTIENYRYTIINGVLTMTPIGPVYCIEGCGDRYVKVE